MPYRLGELFCGPGGIAWGALHADIGNPEYTIVHQWQTTMMRVLVTHTAIIFARMPHRLFTTRTSGNLT